MNLLVKKVRVENAESLPPARGKVRMGVDQNRFTHLNTPIPAFPLAGGRSSIVFHEFR